MWVKMYAFAIADSLNGNFYIFFKIYLVLYSQALSLRFRNCSVCLYCDISGLFFFFFIISACVDALHAIVGVIACCC